MLIEFGHSQSNEMSCKQRKHKCNNITFFIIPAGIYSKAERFESTAVRSIESN